MANKRHEFVEGDIVQLIGGPFDGADAEVIFKDSDGKRVPIGERFCKLNDGPNSNYYVYSLTYESHAFEFTRIELGTKVNKT